MVRQKYIVFAKLFSSIPLRDRPIIVGGTAVEYYTRSQYETLDFDIIADYTFIKNYLKLKGFKKRGHHYYKDSIVIDVVDNSAVGRRIKIMKIGKRRIRIISIEDLIIDRLLACKYWNSIKDCEQAEFLILHYRKQLHLRYLKKRAIQEGCLDALEEYM